MKTVLASSAVVLALSSLLATPALAGAGKRPLATPVKAMKAATAAAAAAVVAPAPVLELEPIQIGDVAPVVDPTAGLSGEAAIYAAFAAAPAVVITVDVPVAVAAPATAEIVFDDDSVVAQIEVTSVAPVGAPVVTPTPARQPFALEERHHRAHLSEIDPDDGDESKPILAKKPLRALSSKVVDSVIEAKYSDQLEYCWMQIPAADRAVESASIHFTISPRGTVGGADLDGDLPAALGACVLQVAKHWTFPASHAETEVDHMLRFATR